MTFQTVEDYFSKINQVYNLILATPLLIFAIIYLEKDGVGGWEPLISNYTYNTVITYSLSIISIVLIGLSFWNFKDQMLKASTKPLKIKLEIYYSAFLNQQIILTVGGLAAIIGVYLTGYHFFSIIYLFSLFTSSIQRPSSHRVVKILKLENKDKEIIMKKLALPKMGNNSQFENLKNP